jgi:aryl-alcohol dehydrogenase-like predicted oxidoreductase
MKYRLLGKSGLRVSELCLGTMTFGEAWGWGASKEQSLKIFEAYTAAGGNFVDTSNNYTDGTSESYLGDFIARDREHFVVATKYSLTERRSDPNFGGNHRKNMMRSVEGSLKRLRTDYIDLLYLHMWDGLTPIDEVLRGMDDLVSAGKVQYIGFSDTPAWVISQAHAIAQLRGWAPPLAVQLPYNLADRSPERELFPMAEGLGMSILAWGILEGGELTGKYNTPSSEPKRSKNTSEKIKALARTVTEIAAGMGRSPSQVAINWVRQQAANIIPILGARTEMQISDNLGCLDFELDPAQMQRLSDATQIDLGFPRAFLDSDHIHGLIFGSTYGMIQKGK